MPLSLLTRRKLAVSYPTQALKLRVYCKQPADYLCIYVYTCSTYVTVTISLMGTFILLFIYFDLLYQHALGLYCIIRHLRMCISATHMYMELSAHCLVHSFVKLSSHNYVKVKYFLTDNSSRLAALAIIQQNS